MNYFRFSSPVELSAELFAITQKSYNQRVEGIKATYLAIQTAFVQKLKDEAFAHPGETMVSIDIRNLLLESNLQLQLTKNLGGAGSTHLSNAEIEELSITLDEYLTKQGVKVSRTYLGILTVNWEPADEKEIAKINDLVSSRII
jgi:hypothetical protein